MKLRGTIIFLCFTTSFYSQIPIKSGIAYYKIKVEMQSEKCLHEMFYDPEFLRTNVVEKISRIDQAIEYSLNEKYKMIREGRMSFNFHLPLFKVTKGNGWTPCDKFVHNMTPTRLILSHNRRILVTQKKIIGITVDLNAKMVFEKKSFTFIVKGADVGIGATRGGRRIYETFKLGEMYTEYQNSEKKDKVHRTIFNDIDAIIKNTIDLYKSTLEDCITLYELDLD